MSRYNDFTFGHAEAIFNKLGGEEAVRRILAGDRQVDVRIKRHVINLNLTPHYNDEAAGLHEHWKERDPRKALFLWDSARVELWHADKQKKNPISGGRLLQEGSQYRSGKKRFASATVADYLMEHKELIPEDWNERAVCFWGTIFATRSGLYVSSLCRRGSRCEQKWLPISSVIFDNSTPALLLKM